jgi:2-polyprenyl-6-methoxyphenol hydroxylase-like FAD-dependent oxidoreductase
LRKAINTSPFCELRAGCKAISRTETPDHDIITYEKRNGPQENIKCSFLVGADGKKGVVRKHFLEPTTDIRQETGLSEYTGTWIAANLKIHLPTPETHPDFPLWQIGFSPDQVYDLFWPEGWHFCTPPGRATATGRFGPPKERLWRHEFAESGIIGDSVEELLWEHLTPMITRTHDYKGTPFPSGVITFPRDCIEVKRCRPFTFEQKVVNKWFHNRTILIGDSAHVFPPFGGQGIACGIRDAHGLAWRLVILLTLSTPSNNVLSERLLTAWSKERRQGVDDSTRLTMSNGKLANEEESWKFFVGRMVFSILSYVPFAGMPKPPAAALEARGYKPTQPGFFVQKYGGGGKMAQIYLQSVTKGPFLSDELLGHGKSVMTLLVIDRDVKKEFDKISRVIGKAKFHSSILSQESFFSVTPHMPQKTQTGFGEVFFPTPRKDLCDKDVRPGYDERAYFLRLGARTKYVILRPGFYIFALANTVEELGECLKLLKMAFEDDVVRERL